MPDRSPSTPANVAPVRLEDSFDVEFLDSMLTRGVFESIGSIESALEQVRKVAA